MIEIEFKYDASGTLLTEFQQFCEEKGPNKKLMTAGYDYFYSSNSDSEDFYRHRKGDDMNQLTFKRKTGNNNYVRVEHNLDLNLTVSDEEVGSLLLEMGYTFNTSLFKTCFIYFFDWYVMSYYICYDDNMKELGRFMEIEIDEERAKGNIKDAFNELLVLEKIFKPLDIDQKHRVEKSLYELYRK